MSDPPASSILDANLAALDAALAASVRAGGDACWLRTASVEGPVLQLRTAAGALVAAHSRRRPDAEAARLVDEALAGRPHPGVAIVIGAGLGYVLDDLLARDATTRFVVIEPDASGVVPWLERRDWRDAIARGRLVVLAGPEYRGSERAWRVVGAGEAAPLIVVHPVLAREYPDEVRRAGSVGVRIVADARANAGAEAALAAPYLLNTIENLGTMAREGDVGALAGAFPGAPAIVVAAGPSLDRVAGDLARYAGRALIIAVDTALRPLLAHRVAPHFVVAVDPSERNARHLSALPDADATWLIAEPGVHPRAFAAFAGRTFTFRVGANPPWPWLEAQGIARGTLAAWGSVLVSALDLAIRLGARPIEIVGADLAYTGGQPYCRGTTFEEDWAREIHWGSSLAEIWGRVVARAGAQMQPDADGLGVPTLPHLVSFRDRLCQQIRAAGDGIANATGGGILHGAGVPAVPLGALVGAAPALGDPRPRIRDIHRQSAAVSRAATAGLPAQLGRPGLARELAAMVPIVDGDLVVSSLTRAREALAAPPTGTPLAPPSAQAGIAAIWLPEQTAALASLGDAGALARAPLPRDATAIEDTDAAFHAALEAGRALVAHASLVTTAPDAGALERDLLGVPLPMLLAFTHDARADADRFGSCLTRWIAASAGEASPADPEAWTAVPVPLDEPAEARRAPLAPDDLGRLAVDTLLAWAAARRGRAGVTVQRAAQAIARSWSRVTATGARRARVRLTLGTGDGSPRRWIDDAPLAPLARALTGVVVRTAAAGVGRAVSGRAAFALRGSLAIESPTGWQDAGTLVTPGTARLLTLEAGAPCLFAATLADGRALVTRADLSGSRLVDEAGRVVAATAWPAPILAEGAWGDTGRAFAWTMSPPRLLVRDADGTIAADVALPFAPSSAEADGHEIRFTALDGVWRWTPGRGAEHVIAAPPLVAALARTDGGLDLAPFPFGDPPAGRARTRPAIVSTPDGTLRETPRAPLGSAWFRAARGGWMAEALPDADLVRIADAGGTRGWVICDSPRTLAWAGRALVVVMTSGDVVHVPDVVGALD
jgi:6-hydroxymethylpterin diphosphokinase MptE-like protein